MMSWHGFSGTTSTDPYGRPTHTHKARQFYFSRRVESQPDPTANHPAIHTAPALHQFANKPQLVAIDLDQSPSCPPQRGRTVPRFGQSSRGRNGNVVGLTKHRGPKPQPPPRLYAESAHPNPLANRLGRRVTRLDPQARRPAVPETETRRRG